MESINCVHKHTNPESNVTKQQK